MRGQEEGEEVVGGGRGEKKWEGKDEYFAHRFEKGGGRQGPGGERPTPCPPFNYIINFLV